MDWWLILFIFVVLVVIIWWALSRQTEDGEAAEAHRESDSKRDDLTKIEGIGPKVQELLNNAGITTFSLLAGTSPERLDEVLDAAGSIYKAMEKKSWPQQASLAAAGEWEELEKLQEELIGGR